MTIGRKPDTNSRSSCGAKLTFEIWEAKHEFSVLQETEDGGPKGLDGFLYMLDLKLKMEGCYEMF